MMLGRRAFPSPAPDAPTDDVVSFSPLPSASALFACSVQPPSPLLRIRSGPLAFDGDF